MNTHTLLLPPPLQAIVFDFDGTLAKPTLDFTLMQQRVEAALQPFCPSLPRKEKMPTLEFINLACQPLETEIAVAARKAAMQAIEDVEVEAARHSGLFPEVLPLLALLEKQNIKTGVITRNCRRAVLAVFPEIAEYTGCLLTRDDVADIKPHPGHLLHALHLLGCLPQNALMVGDHPMDIATGKAAGTLTAGVGTGETPLPRLAEHSPTFLLQNLAELETALAL